MTTRTEPTAGQRRGAARAPEDPGLRRWARLRAHGRSAFVWRNGVVGWGLPAALLTAVYKIVENQGVAWPVEVSAELRLALVLIALVFPALGYLFGGWLWTQGEARYGRELDEATARSDEPPER